MKQLHVFLKKYWRTKIIIIEKTVYTVAEIQVILKIGKNQAYELVHSGVFPVLTIGNTIRISKKPFDEWLYGGGDVQPKPNHRQEISGLEELLFYRSGHGGYGARYGGYR